MSIKQQFLKIISPNKDSKAASFLKYKDIAGQK